MGENFSDSIKNVKINKMIPDKIFAKPYPTVGNNATTVFKEAKTYGDVFINNGCSAHIMGSYSRNHEKIHYFVDPTHLRIPLQDLDLFRYYYSILGFGFNFKIETKNEAFNKPFINGNRDLINFFKCPNILVITIDLKRVNKIRVKAHYLLMMKFSAIRFLYSNLNDIAVLFNEYIKIYNNQKNVEWDNLFLLSNYIDTTSHGEYYGLISSPRNYAVNSAVIGFHHNMRISKLPIIEGNEKRFLITNPEVVGVNRIFNSRFIKNVTKVEELTILKGNLTIHNCTVHLDILLLGIRMTLKDLLMKKDKTQEDLNLIDSYTNIIVECLSMDQQSIFLFIQKIMGNESK